MDRNVYKTANKSTSIHTNQILLSSSRLELYSLIFHARFFKDLNYYEVKLYVKSASFSTDDGQTSRLFIFCCILSIKTSFQNISITLLQISLKLLEHRCGYCRKKPPLPRNTAASKISNGVISLLWQLQCHCNPDHNKFSSLSSTTVVAIFPNLCLWRRSLCSNLQGGIDPE